MKNVVKSKCNKQAIDYYLGDLSNADFRRVNELLFDIGTGLTIKYEDVFKLINLTEKPLKRFLKKIIDKQIIRLITIYDNGKEESYISFNPSITICKVCYNRELIRTWKDIIEKYNLLSKDLIDEILN